MNEQQECCDTPRGFVGGTCDYCGGTVQPEAPEIKLTGAPETDACAKGIDQDNFEGSWRDDFEEFAWVPADFARRLERERDGLRLAYDTAIRQMNQAIAKAEWLRTDAIAKLERERNEAREQCDNLAEALRELGDAEWLNMPGRANDIVEAALATLNQR